MSNSRRWTLIGIGVGVILLAGFLIYVGVNNSSQGDSVLTDRDTGESRDLNPSTQQDTGGAAEDTGEAVVFGLEDLSKNIRESGDGTTGGYFSSIRKAIWEFSSSRLEDKFVSLTVRPQDTVVKGSEISSTLRVGQTDEMLPIHIAVSNNKDAAVITINKDGSQHGGTFVYVSGIETTSFLYSISQVDYSSSDLLITAYAGNRESALNYIESLGYHVPDFSITFNDYRSPLE